MDGINGIKPLDFLNRHKYFSLKLIILSTFNFLFRDLRQEGVRQAHGSWFRLSFVYNHYLFFACILVVLLAIILYLLRLRRIHHRQTRASAPLNLLWIEEVVPMIGVQVGPWGWTGSREVQIPQNCCSLNSTTFWYWPQMLLCLTLWIFGLGISPSVFTLIPSQYPGPLFWREAVI